MPAAVVRIFQFILAPAVMVSACAILIGDMMTQYGAINDRLRTPDGGLRGVELPTGEFAAERLG